MMGETTKDAKVAKDLNRGERGERGGGGIQEELRFETPSERGPDAEVTRMLRSALADGAWHTARDIGVRCFGEMSARELEGLARKLRVVAEHFDTEFVTGNRGYRLLAAATIDEIRETAGRLRTQANKMISRAIALENAAHRRVHRPQPHSAN